MLPHLLKGVLIRRVAGLILVGVFFAELPEKVLKNIKISIQIGRIIFVLCLG